MAGPLNADRNAHMSKSNFSRHWSHLCLPEIIEVKILSISLIYIMNHDNETQNVTAVDKVPSRITMLEGNMNWLTKPRFLQKNGVCHLMFN